MDYYYSALSLLLFFSMSILTFFLLYFAYLSYIFVPSIIEKMRRKALLRDNSMTT